MMAKALAIVALAAVLLPAAFADHPGSKDSPYMQAEMGIAAEDTVCKDGYDLFVRDNGKAACLSPATAGALEAVGLGTVMEQKMRMEEPKDMMMKEEDAMMDGKDPMMMDGDGKMMEEGTMVDGAPIEGGAMMEDAMEKDAMMMDADYALEGKVRIGAVFPLTGDLTVNGRQNSLALGLAIDDFNAELEQSGAGWSIETIEMDTATDPDTAKDSVKEFASQGIRIVTGDMTSAGLTKSLDTIGKEGMLAVVCCSSADTLALKDGVFRMVPDDRVQAEAISRVIENQEKKAIVIIYRNDVWGHDFLEFLENDLHLLKTDVRPGSSIGYDPKAEDFSGVIAEAEAAVQARIDEYGAGSVGVIALSWEEGVGIFKEAAKSDALKRVQWYTSSALSNNVEVIQDAASADFAQNVTLWAVNQDFDSENDQVKRINGLIMEQLSEVPTPYTYSAYDAGSILARSIQAAGSADPAAVMEQIPEQAMANSGALGSTVLSEDGDVEYRNFAVYTVMDGAWVKIGVYDYIDVKLRPVA